MEYTPDKRELTLTKEPNNLDKFVLDFCGLLEKYVVVSGYVSILLGRSRATEDVDLLIPRLNFPEFEAIWKKIQENGFECINTTSLQEAFEMLDNHAIRFCRIGKPIPNMEFKLMKNDIDLYSFENKITVKIKDKQLNVSPLEMQIAYKLFLGSEKDIEDAKHIYVLFNEKLNNDELLILVEKLNVKGKLQLIK